MIIEKGRISGLELMFSITAFIQGSSLYISFTSNITKQDTWLVVISAFMVLIPFALIFASLGKRFAGMNLVQIDDIIFGRYLGKVISILYIYYFLTLLSYDIRELGDFYTTSLMPDTPLIFFLIIFTIVCASAVWKGIETIARFSHFVVIVVFFIIISSFLLLLKDMNFSNILPVFETPLKKFIQGTFIISTIPFGEIVVFLIVMAALNDTEHTTKNTLLGLLLGAISFLIISVRNIAVLGNSNAISVSPTFQATRLIDVGMIFTRMDILIAIGQTVTVFFKCCIFYYATVVALSQLLGLKSYKTIILPIGGIVVIIAIISWQSTADVAMLTPNGYIHMIPFTFIFPPLAMLIAKIRNIPKQERDK